MNENGTGAAVPGAVGWLNLRRLPGDGLLARYGDMTVMCAGTSGALIDALTRVAAPAVGQRPADTLACLLEVGRADTEMPALCAFGPVGDGFAAVVHGDAQVTIALNGQEIQLGRHASSTSADAPTVESVIDVPEPREAVAAVPEPTAQDTTTTAAADPAATPILGVYCSKAHFNDPNVAYCSVCGISMAQADRTPELGSRPSLGTLVLDDGTAFPLVRDQVIGRAPDGDAKVAAGLACPVALPDPLVSRLHARVELRDWQVELVDTGSANGTFVLAPGAATWRRSMPEERTTLLPGSVVAFGRRQLRYHSHRNA